MNEQLILVIGLLALFFLYKRFKANKVKAQLATLDSKDIQLLDVRSEAEFSGFNAPGSLNIPVHSLVAGNTKGLDKSKTLVVYCASGMRSGSACVWLKKQGYKVINAGTVASVVQHINH
ncbi:rhodanese-like domain-containing protein [Vibrio sp. ZSDZ34]|uniref:Rhodanese-like domain-containing protein n=1 Tax=Vibrio gelatinilyticus TaxID=2893468 RepID=A0A9X1WAF1_9VIBR|nr:rhodanese-like domain-containing protein [Vibrio gelatinilyticus]MCJ2376953.1 rhodanese-like domain-containing protein [Vibrio gelatinilyticus]